MRRLISIALLSVAANASTVGYVQTSGSFAAEVDTWTEYTIDSGGYARVTGGDPWFHNEERTLHVAPPVLPSGATITDWHFSVESYSGGYIVGTPEQYNLVSGAETMLRTRPLNPHGPTRAPANLPFWPTLVLYYAATPAPDAQFDLSVAFVRDVFWYDGPTIDMGDNAETSFRVDLQHTIPYEWRLQVLYESPDVHTPEPAYALPLLLACFGLMWRQSRS